LTRIITPSDTLTPNDIVPLPNNNQGNPVGITSLGSGGDSSDQATASQRGVELAFNTGTAAGGSGGFSGGGFTFDDFGSNYEIVVCNDGSEDSTMKEIIRFARDHIKVALGGEGGDELFVGYPIYRAHELLKYMRLVPGYIRRNIMNPFINSLRSSYKNETWEYKLKKFIEAEDYLDNPFYCQQIWLGALGPERLKGLFKEEFQEQISMEMIFQ